MATWREVVESKDYRDLPLGERVKTKNEFFSNIISRSDKFTSLPSEAQAKVKTDFFIPRPEENLNPTLPEKPSISQVVRYATEAFREKSPFKYLDRPVEEVAKFIEPDTAQPGVIGALKFIPRQMLADVVRAYKPTYVGAFGLAAKAIKPIAKPVGEAIAKRIPEGLKRFLLRELTVSKGQPEAYQAIAKEAQLERLKGAREAEDVAKRLSHALEDIEGTTGAGQKILTKKGEVLPKEYQGYIGRIFRKEVDLGGKLSNVNLTPEQSATIAKNVEVEVAFNPKLQKLNKELANINQALGDKEKLAEGLVGKEFRTPTGFTEKASEVVKLTRPKKIELSNDLIYQNGKIYAIGKSEVQAKAEAQTILSKLNAVRKKPLIAPEDIEGAEFISGFPPDLELAKPGAKRFRVGLKSEPVVPKPPTETNIPQEMFPEENIIRSTGQVSKFPSVNQFINKPREVLLKQRKLLSSQIQDKVKEIEIGVRSNYALFDRTFSEQIRTNPKYQQLSAIADEGRKVMDKWSTELAKSGIPKEQTQEVIEKNVGEYMARMYSTKLKPKEGGFSLFKDLRLRLGMLKHRKDLSAEVLAQLGEIKEPALPTAIRVKEISANIANNKLFTKVAQNPEWTKDAAVEGWIKISDTPNVGPLRGKYVIPEIAEDVNAITTAGQQAQSAYLKALNAWKYGKVVLNPATQVRNMLSNTMLLDLSGTNHLRQAQLFPKAFNELLSQGKIYQQALDDGAVGGEFVGGEITRLRDYYLGSQGNNLQRWLNIAKMPFQKAGDLYQGMEQSAKLVKYMDVLEKTGNRQLAAQEAQKWLFNYQEVPKFIDAVRKSPLGAPFITFTYKSLPRIAEAIVDRPLSVYKYYALFNAFNETSRKYQGMLPTEFARQKKLLPPWVLKDIGGVPTNLLMPWKDKYNRTQWLNLEYILPLGQAPEIMEKGLLKGGISNPIFNIAADLAKNTDFKGTPIIPTGATKAEAAQITLSYIYRQLAPNLAPSIPPLTKGGYTFEKILDAVHKRPDFAERTRDLTPVLFDTLAGLKVFPLDVDEAEKFRLIDKRKRIEDLKTQILKLQHPAISEKERDKKTEDLFKKIQKEVDDL